jgi:hypothetical protein
MRDHLELDFHRELNQTWIAIGIIYHSEAVVPGTRGGAIESLSWNPELGMVEQVEEFCPELDADSLGNRGPLEDGEVKVLGPVTAKD